MKARLRAHRLIAFVVLAYGLSWAWWLPMALAGDVARPGQGWPTHLPGLLGPAVAAIVVTAATEGWAGLARLRSRIFRWRLPGRWYALVGATAALLLLAPAVATVLGAASPDPSDYLDYSGIATLPAVATVAIALVVNGFGEEIGWRGFLAEDLLSRHGLLPTALIVVPIWAAWHLPLFVVTQGLHDLGLGGAVGWLLGLACGSLVLTWMYARSGHSIWLAACWHTAFNFTTATTAAQGVPAAVASTVVMAGAVVLVVRRRWTGSRRR